LKALNLGCNAGILGAIYGQLAGAYYCFEAIPSKWIQGLASNEKIGAIASSIC
jgi:ADP-ribosyl-[dinitrogen reductase] hydrolase